MESSNHICSVRNAYAYTNNTRQIVEVTVTKPCTNTSTNTYPGEQTGILLEHVRDLGAVHNPYEAHKAFQREPIERRLEAGLVHALHCRGELLRDTRIE